MPIWDTGLTNFNFDAAQLRTILLSILIFVLLWGGREIVLRTLVARIDSSEMRFQWRKISGYVAFLFGIVALWLLWSTNYRNFATYLGLISAGLAIALQPLIVSMAGWLFLVTRRPFKVGDRIEIGEHAGDVLDIQIFQFALMEIGNWVDADHSTGRIVFIPNSHALRFPVANYTGDFEYIWNELPITVTFESDWRKAKGLLRDIAEDHGSGALDAARRQLRSASNRLVIRYPNLTPIVYTQVEDNGVTLTVRYLCKPQRRRSTQQAMWEDILDAFAAEPNIAFAYATTRFYTSTTPNERIAQE